jgi:hypothetical protein
LSTDVGEHCRRRAAIYAKSHFTVAGTPNALTDFTNIHQGNCAMKTQHTFTAIDRDQLEVVSGGAARVAAANKSSDLDSKLQLMLTQIGDSIKEVGKSSSSGNDMMPMMMMMMMMGGGGGGGGGAAPAAAPPPPPQAGTFVKVNVR